MLTPKEKDDLKLLILADIDQPRFEAQVRQDLRKTADLTAQGIAVLRLNNAQVFGDRTVLVELLRGAWRSAKLAQRSAGAEGAGLGHYRAREPLAFYFVSQPRADGALSPA